MSNSAAQQAGVPAEWQQVSLGDILHVSQYGLSVRGNATGRYPILRMNCQESGRVIMRDLQYVDISDREFEAHRLYDLDLLFNRTNSYELVGRTAIYRGHQDAVFASYLLRLRVDDSKILPEYLNFYLNSPDCQATLKTFATRGVSQANISASKLRNLPVTLPPKAEQAGIATVLESIQERILLQRRRVDLLAALKLAMMTKLFREGLHGEPLKQTVIGAIPESWNVVRLGDVAQIERGKFAHRPRNDPRFYGGTIPFIQTGDAVRALGRLRTYTQTLNDLGLSVSRVFPKGTIVITIAANIGDTAILDLDAAFPDSLVGITPASAVETEYLEFFLRTQKEEMNRLAPKGTQKNINIEFLRPWPIALPPSLDEQLEIASILRTIEQRELHGRNLFSTLSELFTGLLQQLMTGAIRVKDLDLAEVNHA